MMNAKVEQKTELTTDDIGGMVQIIDMATQRGAIRGEEMLLIGTLRQKMVNVLKSEQEKAQMQGAVATPELLVETEEEEKKK